LHRLPHYLQKHAGSAEFAALLHCATCGAWQEISHFCPSYTVLHMLPVRPTIEFVIAPVPSVITELVTLDWLSRMTEPALPVELLDETELPARDVMLPEDTVLPSRDVIVCDETVLPSRDVIVLDVPSVTTLCARTLVQRPNAANVRRCFIWSSPRSFRHGVRKH
jgi:hypothetical protein